MENIINRFGGFDFWVTLFPGIVCIWGVYSFLGTLEVILTSDIASQTVEKTISLQHIYCPDNIYALLEMVIFSYLAGLIIHELSGFLKKIVYRKGKPTECILSHHVMNKYEINNLKILKNMSYDTALKEHAKDDNKELSKFIFNHMNYSLQMKNKTVGFAKLSQIYNMCMSLAVVFDLFIVFGLVCILVEVRNGLFVWVIITIFFNVLLLACSMILINRGKNFYRYWVRAIVYAYDIENEKV